MVNLKKSYTRSLRSDALHFAAHSHHPRPDITREATEQCWDDAALMLDNKWDYIFSCVVPEAQRNVAALLNLSRPQNIAFGGNTHEFVARILSALDLKKPLRILTTGSEFRSFSRQLRRFVERGNVFVTEVPVFPHANFVSRFVEASEHDTFDLVFFSQVFYDSGFRIDDAGLEKIVAGISASQFSSKTVIVIDGYHGFCAVPTSLKAIEDRVFYLAGGYKYAQWGEGACFLYVPPNCTLRPENTGWFAEFGNLSGDQSTTRTAYSDDAFRFWGATFDPAGLYRLNAVCAWMRMNGIRITETHGHAVRLQTQFLANGSRLFNPENLRTPIGSDMRGNFLSFAQRDSVFATTLVSELGQRGVMVDSRGQLVRIGFGIYHDVKDVEMLWKAIKSVEAA